MTAGEPLVVEAVRGDLVESTHLIDVVIVDAGGTTAASAGDPGTVAYLRSSAKPVQATVCLELGWDPPADEQLAVACASHNGEPVHVEAVRETLRAAGLDETALRCPGPAPIVHNCSGKHAAMLAACVANGWDPARYLDPDGPIQAAVRRRIEDFAGRPSRAVATDGCGAQTFAFSLTEAAALAVRLPRDAPRAIAAMRAHPYLVAGAGRLCTAVMSAASGVVLKVGAEGLLCGVLMETGVGFAMKARDGVARGREVAAVWLLERLGVLTPDTAARVLAEVLPNVVGAIGRHPEMRCRGELIRGELIRR